ncbi:MAG TPA: tetratricopeptide repeat protein [Candidatus Competibacter sp.]|nr:tetratricopeptide repeat protein [Candidatus Competibacter sp.]
MNTSFKPCLFMLTLALGITACSTTPFSRQPPSKPAAKAPVVDRSARRPPAYPAQPPQSSPADAGWSPQEDPLLPRERSSAYPAAPDAYGSGYVPPATAPTYPDAYGSAPPTRPYRPNTGSSNQQPAYPPPSAEGYRPPAYPPGAATPYPPPSQAVPGSLPEPQPAVVPPAPRPKPPSSPPPAANTPAPADTTVAMTTPPATPAPAPVSPPAPAPRPVQPPPPPANLPPAEISRDGNQAVVALLESADKYVKSNQLDKAGAALERALRIEPRNAGIWHDLAQIRLHQGQYQQAESLASKSNNLAGGNRALQSRNWKLIGSARKAAGNAPGAEEAEAHASQLSN